jgi:hypothetical protein
MPSLSAFSLISCINELMAAPIERCSPRRVDYQRAGGCHGLPVAGIVQLTQIADGPLSWTIGRADGLHQRPIPVLLTVFAPMVLAQKHPEVMVSGEKLRFKWVGLHYIAFSIDRS